MRVQAGKDGYVVLSTASMLSTCSQAWRRDHIDSHTHNWEEDDVDDMTMIN